jgi:hypothetical protein
MLITVIPFQIKPGRLPVRYSRPSSEFTTERIDNLSEKKSHFPEIGNDFFKT